MWVEAFKLCGGEETLEGPLHTNGGTCAIIMDIPDSIRTKHQVNVTMRHLKEWNDEAPKGYLTSTNTPMEARLTIDQHTFTFLSFHMPHKEAAQVYYCKKIAEGQHDVAGGDLSDYRTTITKVYGNSLLSTEKCLNKYEDKWLTIGIFAHHPLWIHTGEVARYCRTDHQDFVKASIRLNRAAVAVSGLYHLVTATAAHSEVDKANEDGPLRKKANVSG